MRQIKLETVDSTNEYLKREYQHLDKQCVVIAKHQSHGKGRIQRDWDSDENNLMLSFLYQDMTAIEDAWKMSILVACSVVGLLDRHHIKATIKWPNDVYVEDQKICGILVETILDPDYRGVIIGMGLNVNGNRYLSMKQVTKKTYSLNAIATGLITFMNIYYNLYQTNQFDKVLEYANSISYLKDKWVDYLDYGLVKFECLNDDGSLTFCNQQGQMFCKILNEISLHKDNNQ